MSEEVNTVQDEADRVLISGSSDDRITVEGAITEEFCPGLEVEDEGVYLALSCGTLLKVRFDGSWTIQLEYAAEEVALEHELAHDHDGEKAREYSDYMEVTADDIDWVLMGQHAVISGR